MYKAMIENNNFNYKMIDGALISMSYTFKNKQLIKHRLSFFPAPNLESFQNEPDGYLEDELYNEIIDRRIVAFPIRFDFDTSDGVPIPLTHPKSHLTLGQYKHCRIPVSTALTPYQFLNFIITNFYNTIQDNFSNQLSVFKDCFDLTIFDNEREVLHVNTPVYRN